MLSGWSTDRRIRVIIPAQSEELTDFRLLIRLSSSCGTGDFDATSIFSELGENYLKVAFEVEDSGVQCYAECVKWDSTNLIAEYFVKVTAGTSETKLWVYADSAHSDNTTYIGTPGTKGVLVGTYTSLAVIAKGTDGATTIPDLAGHTITSSGNIHIEHDQSLTDYSSVAFDGVGDYGTIAYSSNLDLVGNDCTIVFPIYPTHSTNADGRRILASGGGTVAWNSTNGIHWLLQIKTTGALELQYWNGAASQSISLGLISTSTWDIGFLSVSSTTVLLGIGGSTTSGTISWVRPSTNPSLTLGTIPGENGATGYAFMGYMDDISIEKGIGRSSAWYSATYDSLFDDFVAYAEDDGGYGETVHILFDSSGEGHTDSIGYGDSLDYFVADSFGYVANIGYGDSDEFFSSEGIGWVASECFGDSIHSMMISYGVSFGPAYGYYDGAQYPFVCSGEFTVGDYAISRHYLSQSVGEGTSITVVYGNSVHKEIITGETDIFRFALGNAYMLISTVYGRGWIVPPGIGYTEHEDSLSSGMASTGNWGVVDAVHSLMVCSGVAVGNPIGYGDTVHRLFKSFGVSELGLDAATLTFSRCSSSILPTVDPDPITALRYERCS